MSQQRQQLLTLFVPWCVLTLGGALAKPILHSSATYFLTAFSITGFLVLLIMYWAVSGSRSNTPASVTIALSSIALKLMLSTGIFLYYFIRVAPGQDPMSALKTGALIYCCYTVLVAWYGLYWGGGKQR